MAVNDDFSTRRRVRIDPPGSALAVTPDDDNDLSDVSTAVYVGTTGDVRVTMDVNREVVTFPNMSGGCWHPMQVCRIHDTGTTATGLLIGW